MRASILLPDDLYGFSIEQLKQILERVKKISGASLTNKKYSYDVLKGYRVESLDGIWRIVAPSKKKLNIALDEIQRERRRGQKLEPFKFKK